MIRWHRQYVILQSALQKWWLGHVLPYSTSIYCRQNGEDLWLSHGVLHHATEPAKTTKNGSKQWYWCGLRHRADGPAIEDADGTLQWYQNGKRHCIGQPAYTNVRGVEMWFKNDQFHRVDGPAIIDAQGDFYWWFEGTLYISPTVLNDNSSLMTLPHLFILSMVAHAPTLERLIENQRYYHYACQIMPELSQCITAKIHIELIAGRARDIIEGLQRYDQNYSLPFNLEI